MTYPRGFELDWLDVKLAEIEAAKVTICRKTILEGHLEHCSKIHPECPFLHGNYVCPDIREDLEETVLEVLSKWAERN